MLLYQEPIKVNYNNCKGCTAVIPLSSAFFSKECGIAASTSKLSICVLYADT